MLLMDYLKGLDEYLTTDPRDTEHHDECDHLKEDVNDCNCEDLARQDRQEHESRLREEGVERWREQREKQNNGK